MQKELSDQLQKAIRAYNCNIEDRSEHLTYQDVVAEIGSTDNEEVLKAIELLKAKTENQ